MEGEVWTGSVVLRTEARPDTCFRRMVRRLAKDFLTDEADRRYYADRYTCCPPPLFVPIITLLEVRVACQAVCVCVTSPTENLESEGLLTTLSHCVDQRLMWTTNYCPVGVVVDVGTITS